MVPDSKGNLEAKKRPGTVWCSPSVLLLTWLCGVVCMSALTTFSFLQHRDIADLRLRVTELELRHDPTGDVIRNKKEKIAELVRSKRQAFTPTPPVPVLTPSPPPPGGQTFVSPQTLQEFSKKQFDLLKDYCGNSSKICLKGEPGTRGDKGEQGNKGLDGIPGPKGQKGMYGISGPTGPIGDIGPKGERGPKGDLGTIGTQGPRGLQGPKGEKGDRGVDGAAGGSGGTTVINSPIAQSGQCCNNLSPPKVASPTTTFITAPQGSKATLPCRIIASPPAEVTFVPAVDPIQNGRYVHTPEGMEISDLQYLDTGEFVCTAHNVFGTVQKIIKLIVTNKVTASVNPTTSVATAGTTPSVDFVCQFHGVPPPNITWLHTLPGRQPVQVTSGVTIAAPESHLVVTNPGALDTGVYKCIADNGIETVTSTSNLTVYSKPQIVHGPDSQTDISGQNIVLRCDTVSIPPAQITWTFPKTGNIPPKDVRLNPDNSITILNVDSFNDGDYICTATNSYGTSTSTGTLNIISPLTVVTSPHSLPVKVGDTFAQIQCTATGNPNPTTTWAKDGLPVLTAGKYLQLGNGEIIITNVDPDSDTGIYTCTGSKGNESKSDSTIVYKDLGALTCDMTFADCTNRVGSACGGTCPGNCQQSAGDIYGYKVYTLTSHICKAAQHTGNGNPVLWNVINGGNTYESKTSNGITSSYSGPLAESASLWTRPAAPLTPGVPALIGK